MPWSELVDSLVPVQSLAMMTDNTKGQKILQELASKNPSLYWYPGCGRDLTPLLFDVPNNSMEERIYPLEGPRQKSPLILWMNDYVDPAFLFPSFQPTMKWADVGFLEQFQSIVDVRGPFLLYGLAVSGDEYPGGSASRVIPISIFHVGVKNERQKSHQRPKDGDSYTVIFSYCESEFLLRNVFAAYGINVRAVALLNQGGMSIQRQDFDQYKDIPRLLDAYTTDVGTVELFIVDHKAITCGFEPINKVIIDGERRARRNINDQCGEHDSGHEPFADAMIDALHHPGVMFQMYEEGRDEPMCCPCSDFLSVPLIEQQLLREALSGFRAPRVLDIGCGIGRHLKFVRGEKAEAMLTGVELSPKLRELCAHDLPHATFITRFEDIPKESHYDMILLMGNGLGVFGTEDHTCEALQRIHELLSDNGVLIVESGISRGTGFQVLRHKIEYKGQISEEFCWGYASQEWLKSKMQQIGFKGLTFQPSRGPFFLCAAGK